MNQQPLSGYICTDAERMARRYIAPAGLIVMLLITCFLVFQVFQSHDKGPVLAFLVGWIALTICLCISYRSVQVADRLAFCITREKIINSWPTDNKLELDLHSTYFCTLFTCTFAYGKASQERQFYLFHTAPFSPDILKGEALRALESIHKNNIIILPKTDAVDAWLAYHLHIGDIPNFPYSICSKEKGV